MYTLGQLKSDVRARLWPTGEAANLVVSHNQDFIDAIIDLQQSVVCLQRDNTDLIPHCATTYKCGLTVLPLPRGYIKRLSIIDKINPDTGKEDPEAEDDYCSEIVYTEVDFCHVRNYLTASNRAGCCGSIGLWFGLPFTSFRRSFPTPTDEGLPAGLPVLPLGFHYPQESTDRSYGRAGAGVWAKDRGSIYVAPFIQSTETIILKWDGIKRTWTDADPVDQNPLFSKAVEEYARWQHARKHDRDQQMAEDAKAEYMTARAELIAECRRETMVRRCEPSFAAASSLGLQTIYHNEDQSATAACPDGETGSPVTVTIPAGTVGSNISVADANQKAKSQAQVQAQAQLVCTAVAPTFTNTVAGDYTASCQGDTDAPTPDGAAVHVTIPIGTVTAASVDAANAAAQLQAEVQAKSQLVCTFWNRAKSFSATCSSDPGIDPITVTIPAGTYSGSTQALADQQALTAATNQATEQMAVVCTGDGPQVWNIPIINSQFNGGGLCRSLTPPFAVSYGAITVFVTMPDHIVSGTTQGEAQARAQALLVPFANQVIANVKAAQRCGTFHAVYPIAAV